MGYIGLWQMSFSGAIFIFAIMIIRALTIRRLPKITFLVLWYIALARLLLPVIVPVPAGMFPVVGEGIFSLAGESASGTIRDRIYDFFTGALQGGFGEMGIGSLQDSSGEMGIGSLQDGSGEIGAGGWQDSFWKMGTGSWWDGFWEFGSGGSGELGSGDLQMAQNQKGMILVRFAFCFVWILGMAVVAGYLVVRYLRCRREFGMALPVKNDTVSLWLRGHPLRRTLEIRELGSLSTPLAYGVFHPVILVPKKMDWEGEAAPYILFHEYVHIRRFDALGKWIASAVLCIHWFNPLVWVLYALFNRDMELSCDERVIWHFGKESRKNYAMALLLMEERRNSAALFGNYFSKNAAKERVKLIMKCRKKTVFAVVCVAVVASVGAVAVFVMPPRTGNAGGADFGDVLKGDAPFFYVSGEEYKAKNISDVPALFDPEDDAMKIWNFAVLDLDGDGKDEVILSVMGVAGDMGGSLILHQVDGKIYGYLAGSRELTELKADGTFHYSDPTGMAEGGVGSIAEFTKTGYMVDKITYGSGTYAGWDTFVVERQPATEEGFWAAENAQAGKVDVVWYDFEEENAEFGF